MYWSSGSRLASVGTSSRPVTRTCSSPRLIKRGRVNRLVIRVDSRRKQTDFPPSGLSIVGKPTGGWWNYGGLLREVYLRAHPRARHTTPSD